MDIPLGLSYKPMFPVVQSIFKQMDQLRREKEKVQAEAKKTALQKAQEDMIAYYKFDGGDYPYIKSLEPHNQFMLDHLFETNRKVQNGELDRQVLYSEMAAVKRSQNMQKRINSELVAKEKIWADSGDFNMEKVHGSIGEYGTNLNATAANGEIVRMRPEQYDLGGLVNSVETNLENYNISGMVQKWMGTLGSAEYTVDLPGGQTVTRKGLPDSYYSDVLGSSGQRRLAAGPRDPNTGEIVLNSDQAKVLLNRFRTQNPHYDNILQVMTAQAQMMKPEGERVQPGTEKWGVEMQKSLTKVLDQYGWIAEDTKTAPTPEARKGPDSNYIGGDQKYEMSAFEGAKIIRGLMENDPVSQSFYRGPYVKDTQYDATSGILTITPPAGKSNDLLSLINAVSPDNPVTADESGNVKIHVTRDDIPQLTTQLNAIAKTKYNQAHVLQAYDKYFGNIPLPMREGEGERDKAAEFNRDYGTWPFNGQKSPNAKPQAAAPAPVKVTTVDTKEGVKIDSLSNNAKLVLNDLGNQTKGIVVTDTVRTDAQNKAVGGVDDSYHKTGDAFDIRVTPEATEFFTSEKGKKWADEKGYQIIDERNREGHAPHWHLEPKAGAAPAPSTGQRGVPFLIEKAEDVKKLPIYKKPANVQVKDGYAVDLFTAPNEATYVKLYNALPEGAPYRTEKGGPVKYKKTK